MNEIIANYAKIVIGLIAIILAVGFSLGHVSLADLQTLIPLLLGGHALISGVSSVLTGPTANKDLR